MEVSDPMVEQERPPLTAAERQRRARYRRKAGLVCIRIDLPEDVLREIERQGLVELDDENNLAAAISELIEDAIGL